ncbi:hypothetical protein D5085_02545 [Ectothiorhodospiraceae bacterium BW-2]|nr:hypothetical protein D5085_02545 [Ectothiorhodospiraceae bacterium BW-2]
MPDNQQEMIFLTRYSQARVQLYEQTNIAKCPKDTLFNLGQEASAILKYMDDLQDETFGIDNAETIIDAIVGTEDAYERLAAFVGKVVKQLGAVSKESLFYLCPESAQPTVFQQTPEITGEQISLNAYLDYLLQQGNQLPDISHCFTHQRDMEIWQENTRSVIQEIVNFMRWMQPRLQQHPAVTPVFLLRDTLLVYLGFVWLQNQGMQLPPLKPLLLNRTVLKYCAGDTEFYYTMADTLYDTLNQQGECDLHVFCHDYIKKLFAHADLPQAFWQVSKAQLDMLQTGQPLLIVETGVLASFPLWLLALAKEKSSFVLYATAPWLLPIYKDITFQKNYHYLIQLEKLVIQDYLFQFHHFLDTETIVQKTANQEIESLALYELACFKELLFQGFSTL